MSSVIHVYGSNNYSNIGTSSSGTPKPLAVVSATDITGANSSTTSFEFKGNFTFADNQNLTSSIRGTATDVLITKNSQLSLVEQYSPGVDITKIISGDSLIAGDDQFLCSTDTAQDDFVRGGTGNDKFSGGGDVNGDAFNGEGGIDTSIYRGLRSEYTVASQSVYEPITTSFVSGLRVNDTHSNRDGNDSLVSVERLQFSDKSLGFDLGVTESSGGTALLLGAVLGKNLMLSKQPLLGAVIGLFDQGYTLQQLSGAVMRLPIWDILTGHVTPTNTDIANYLLTTVNGHAPDSVTLNAAVTALNAETGASQGNFLASLAASAANQTQINLVGLQQTGLDYV